MSLFEKFFSQPTTTKTYKANSEREAWMACVVACMYIDEETNDVTINRLSNLFLSTSIFRDTDVGAIFKEARIKHIEFGSRALINGSITYIHIDSRDTLFAKCCEIIIADGVVTKEEEKILEYLRQRLDLNEELAKKIIEVMIIKNKREITSCVID